MYSTLLFDSFLIFSGLTDLLQSNLSINYLFINHLNIPDIILCALGILTLGLVFFNRTSYLKCYQGLIWMEIYLVSALGCLLIFWYSVSDYYWYRLTITFSFMTGFNLGIINLFRELTKRENGYWIP